MLVDLQVKGGKITDWETYKQGILAREENGSTAVGEGSDADYGSLYEEGL